MAIGENREMRMEVRKRGLSEAKLRLLQARILGRLPHGERERDQIRPRTPGATVPLSLEQRRVWLHALQQPDLPIYNEPFTIHRHGTFNLGILQASINEILRRHEAWRTSFSAKGQIVIHDSLRVTLPFYDLSGLPGEEREAEALQFATEDARKPIALDSAPLFRARVMRMQPDEHRLYLTFHHIIFDAVSISRIFLPELSAIYAAFEQGQPCPLPPPTLQYGDYAVWREIPAESPTVKQHLAYWVEHLSGELPLLRLPEDRPRPAITSHRGSMECFKIPAELVERLHQLSNRKGVTLYMSLLAAFKVLLFRYSGQNDLVIGSATDARRRPELEAVMGFFVDTFAVRTRPAAKLRFSEYLAQTREAVLRGLAAAEVPFDRVAQAVNPRRDNGHHPIFQAFFSIRPPMPRFAPGWNLTQMDVTVGTSKFVLHLELCERPDHMEARFLYNTDIWIASTIKRMAAHWLMLLQSVCRNPETTLGTLAMLTEEETAALLGSGGWNDTACAVPQVPFDTLFEDQVRRTPNTIAAAFGNERWTYEELNDRADQLALLLREAGVTRGSIVAIMVDRSLDLLAALLAVLKTGAAYLPIDIQMPPQRIALCLADAKPAAILTQRSLEQGIPSAATAVVLVDGTARNQDATVMDSRTAEPASTTHDLDDTAYVIYTSGTTGKPKAVEISHRGLVNLLAAMQTSPGFGSRDVFLAETPISFDMAVPELFLPIISGGMVVIVTRDEAQDPYLLAKAIRRSRCTVMQATPATWRILLLSGWKNERRNSAANPPKNLRVLCGGDALPRELADRLLAAGVELWNMYGPTETTVWSLIHGLRADAESESGRVPVGHPIANTSAYILDEQLQLLPVGIPGELYLGGMGLAKGYRGKPQQTAERFIVAESVGNMRLYRTGDLAVRRADGRIEVLGRCDNQVKVRGYRVELEEVEAAVLLHPHVAAAAARVWPEATGDNRLSVYVVAHANHEPPNLADLRAFLGRRLPASMIPSDVIPLPAIPLTSHGKIDRARLPAPATKQASPPPTILSSSDQKRLAAIWSDLLGEKQIGPDDNFFDLGGHSLLLAVLQLRIASEFGRNITIVELFHNSTIRQQAELTERPSKDRPDLPPGVLALQPHGARNSIFWVHYLMGDLAYAIGDDQPFFPVVLTAADLSSLGESPSMQSIAACQVRKILATQPEGPYTIGGFCAGGVLAYEVASQLRLAGREVSLLVLVDADNWSYSKSRDSLRRRLGYLPYALKRAKRLGLRLSLAYCCHDMLLRFSHPVETKLDRTEMRAAQEMLEAAGRVYRPARYEGKVLLLLASEHAPHRDLLPGWQEVIPRNLHTCYLSTHHRDLLNAQNVRNIANAIVHFIATTDNPTVSGADTSPDPWLPAQTA